MKKVVVLAVLILIAVSAQSQSVSMFNRVDTCLAGAAGGVTAWKPCKLPSVGKGYTFSAIATTQTALVQFAFTWRDTAAARASGNYVGGGVIPFISGQTITVSVPSVPAAIDTIWIKGATNDIIRMWKF